MKKITPFLVTLLLAGCSFDVDKLVPDVFKKPAGLSTAAYTQRLKKYAINVTRDGVTFNDGSFITPEGEGNIILPQGYYYVNSSGGRILASNNYGNIMVLKENGEELARTKLRAPLVSGATYSGGIVYLLAGNYIGLYDPFRNKITYERQLKGGYAVDNRLANPIVAQNFIAIPTLDGKLVLISRIKPDVPRAIPIGENKNYGNIIFLKALDNKMIAATPSRLFSIGPNEKHEKEIKVADITIKDGFIYLLTRDGWVKKLDSNLNEVLSRKFNYADFATIAILPDKICAFAKSGSLVVMDKNMQKYRVYSLKAAKNYSYASGNYLYVDDRKLDLSALKYE